MPETQTKPAVPYQLGFCRQCGHVSSDYSAADDVTCSRCGDDSPLATFERTWPEITPSEQAKITASES